MMSVLLETLQRLGLREQQSARVLNLEEVYNVKMLKAKSPQAIS